MLITLPSPIFAEELKGCKIYLNISEGIPPYYTNKYFEPAADYSVRVKRVDPDGNILWISEPLEIPTVKPIGAENPSMIIPSDEVGDADDQLVAVFESPVRFNKAYKVASDCKDAIDAGYDGSGVVWAISGPYYKDMEAINAIKLCIGEKESVVLDPNIPWIKTTMLKEPLEHFNFPKCSSLYVSEANQGSPDRFSMSINAINIAIGDTLKYVAGAKGHWNNLTALIVKPDGGGSYSNKMIRFYADGIHPRQITHEFSHFINDEYYNDLSPFKSKELKGLRDLLFAKLSINPGPTNAERMPGNINEYAGINDNENFAETFASYRYNGKEFRELMGITSRRKLNDYASQGNPLDPMVIMKKTNSLRYSIKSYAGLTGYAAKYYYNLRSAMMKQFPYICVKLKQSECKDRVLLTAKYIFMMDYFFKGRQFSDDVVSYAPYMWDQTCYDGCDLTTE